MAQHDAGTRAQPYPEPFPVTAAGGYDGRARPASAGQRTLSWASTGRIALAVFAGVLLALVVAGYGLRLYIGHEVGNVGDELDKTFGTSTSDDSGLSSNCKNTIDQGDDESAVGAACAGEDSGAIQAYESSVGYTGT
jgi:hypothetical protein